MSADDDAGHSPNTYQERNDREIMVTAFALNEMGITSVPNLENRPDADAFKTSKWLAEEAQIKSKQEALRLKK